MKTTNMQAVITADHHFNTLPIIQACHKPLISNRISQKDVEVDHRRPDLVRKINSKD